MAEIVGDGPPSPAYTERALVEVAAERDQLRQQVEKLLAETDALVTQLGYIHGDPVHRFKQAADQVRKELEDA